MKRKLSAVIAWLIIIHLAVGGDGNFPDKKKKWDEITQQEVDHSYKPLTLKLTDDGTKYVRFIIWHQQWFQTNNLAVADSKFQVNSLIRRSRFLALAQISPRFLILTHFGLNNLTTANMTSLGNNGDGPQMFLHDAWTEFKISSGDQLFIGSGLHYWNGLTRLSSHSTLNFMPMDNTRPFVHWHSLGLTDQFVRHMGIYAKGQLGKFDYRMSVNNPMIPANAFNGGNSYTGDNPSTVSYTGQSNLNENQKPVANTIISGYFRYSFLDIESTKLPYQVGTYFGQKKIFSIGAGFFAHPNALYDVAKAEHSNVLHLAADVYYDAPLGKNGVNFYASFIKFDYGENYMARWAGTGTNIYAHAGYYLSDQRLMPYIAFQNGNYEAYDEPLNALDLGINYHLNGHNAKITLEWHQVTNNPLEGGVNLKKGNPQDISQVRVQAHIFL